VHFVFLSQWLPSFQLVSATGLAPDWTIIESWLIGLRVSVICVICRHKCRPALKLLSLIKSSETLTFNNNSYGPVFHYAVCIRILTASLIFSKLMQTKSIHGKVYQSTSKSFFVEIRTFWHIFRSFDRLWAFYILGLQVFILNLLKYDNLLIL
jgi:hypothetical protein